MEFDSMQARLWPVDPITPGATLGLQNLVTLRVFHLLREVKVSCAFATQLVMNTERWTESFYLSATTIDPSALASVDEATLRQSKTDCVSAVSSHSGWPCTSQGLSCGVIEVATFAL
eukprot:3380172-Amphidinium_carterae.2